MNGFVKYNRSEQSKRLHSRPNENHVLSVIAYRTSREGNPVKGVQVGECIISDYDNFGLKRQPMRTAITNLRKWGYITTRATNKTTYAKLVNTDVYDCNLIATNQQNNQQLTSKNTNEQPPKQPTANHYQEVKNKEVKNKEVLPYEKEFFTICEQFKKITGKTIRVQDTPAKIKRSDKYKIIAARLNAGASVEEMIKVIELKNNQWRDDKRQSKYIQFSTLFAASNYEKYIDELDNETPTKNTTHENAPTDPKERFKYFQKVFLTYAPQLDRRLVNGQYKKMLYTDRNAEGLVTMLENEQPKLLELWHNIQ